MEIFELIKQRHSVRAFIDKPINPDTVAILQEEIMKCNKESNLNIQLITEDKDAFNTMLAHYGKFSNAFNYLAIVGKKSKDNDINAGYYGEKLVLLAQSLGLNSCWVALTYSKKKNKIKINPDEKLICVIALGYGVNQGNEHKVKSFEQVTDKVVNPPDWFKQGVQAAILAPTAMNQQKFKFILDGNKVSIKKGWGPYTTLDMGIVKYHFESVAGKENFIWS